MIQVRAFAYRYRQSRRYALQDVDLSIPSNEFVVINGPSGGGKSTLALALGGFLFRQYDGDARGSIEIDGVDVRAGQIYEVAERVGLVQQNPEAQFCTLTVRDEVAFGLENRRVPPDEIERRLSWALQVVGAERLVDRSLSTLSGGEKQKVAIAAVMAARPRVLILDEPTSNLDPTSTAQVLQVINRIRAEAGLTVIVIEHKVSYLMPLAPRLVTLAGGCVAYDGPLTEAHAWPVQAPSESASVPDGSGPAVVDLQDVWIRYGAEAVLQGISLKVHPGELVAVMGDNGSGKTTLLRTCMGLLKPDEGKASILGADTGQAQVSQLAQQVGYVFQNPDHQIFGQSVWQEAVFALDNLGKADDDARSRVRGLLERCGLGARREDHPYRLSYGEKRRLNLIAALGHRPSLLLLDEVLIGQDPENAGFLLSLLQEEVRRGGAVIMINHNPQITSLYATRVILLQGGRVRVDAPTQDALRQMAQLGLGAYLPVREAA